MRGLHQEHGKLKKDEVNEREGPLLVTIIVHQNESHVLPWKLRNSMISP